MSTGRSSLKNTLKLIQQATQGMPDDQAFLADLKAVIERTQEQKTPSKSYKPSSLDCLRKMYYEVTGESQDGDKADHCLIGMAETGTYRHGVIQDAISKMKDMGIDCEWIDIETFIKQRKPPGTKVIKKVGNETKCYNEILNMSFLCDGVIRYKSRYYILEIKTEISGKWERRTCPDNQHVTQATCYSVCLLVDAVMFVYENRDTCNKQTYIVHVTNEMKQERVVGKIETCNNYVGKLTPPPRTTCASDCKYCKYKKACKRDGG